MDADYEKRWNDYFIDGTTVFKNYLGITDYDELMQKEADITFERLVELSFYFDVPIDKVEEIIKYYSLKIFSERTKEKILMLQDKFIDNLTDDTISKFEYMYYQYYHSVENERKQRLQCMLLGEGKTYIK